MTRRICPTCSGRGKIRNPKTTDGSIPYIKDITCPNCQGEGFVGLPIKKRFYKELK